MKERTTGFLCLGLLLVVCSGLSGQKVGPTPNMPCAGRSSNAFVNWPEFRSDPCRTGYNANEFILGPSTVGNLVPGWLDSPVAFGTNPTVVSGRVYSAGSLYNGPISMYALDATTGEIKWQFEINEPTFSTATVAEGVVYFSDWQTGNLYAVDDRYGSLLWSVETGTSSASSPTVVNGVVYANGSYLYALNAKTGTVIWKYPIENYSHDDSSSPAVANGVVYVGSTGGDYSLLAVNAATGQLVWKYPTGYAIATTPAVVNGVVYFSSYDQNIYALKADTGALVWKYPTQCDENISSPAVANGIVYIGACPGYLYALDANTGALRWQLSAIGPIESSPAIANGVVYVGSYNGNLYALDANTGAILWKYFWYYEVSGSPAVVNGVVYFSEGKIYTFHLLGH